MKSVVATAHALTLALTATTLLSACGTDEPMASDAGPPNVVLVFVDDMGWGDLGVYGSTTIATPNLDALADGGVRFTQAYVGNSVCTPSRAVLLTGRFGPRQVLEGTAGGVYFPGSPTGMDTDQITLAELLADAGYATALVGKWHLGDAPEFLPTRQGFELFFGLPYSNDMDPLPLMLNETVIDELETVDVATTRLDSDSKQATLTGQYTERAIRFIREAHESERPFFLYYANNFPHTPIAASPRFAGSSPSCEQAGAERSCGLYADVVAELDWSVGEIVAELEALGIEERTIVIFTSDNGPWLIRGTDGGTQGPLREGKSTTFEGGYRVPMIASWPGTYRAGVVEESPTITTDWTPTLASAAGVAMPEDRAYDGLDLGPLLRGEGARDPSGEPFRFIYYRSDNETPGGYREGKWKYKAPVVEGESVYALYDHGELLFDLEADPGEAHDVGGDHPQVLERLRDTMGAFDAELKNDALR